MLYTPRYEEFFASCSLEYLLHLAEQINIPTLYMLICEKAGDNLLEVYDSLFTKLENQKSLLCGFVTYAVLNNKPEIYETVITKSATKKLRSGRISHFTSDSICKALLPHAVKVDNREFMYWMYGNSNSKTMIRVPFGNGPERHSVRRLRSANSFPTCKERVRPYVCNLDIL